MSRLIAHDHVNGLRIFRAADNPLTVAAYVTIGGDSQFGVLGRPSVPRTLVNRGTVLGRQSGVTLMSGGEVVNQLVRSAVPLIEGGAYGIRVSGGTGTVLNDGTITASRPYRFGGPGGRFSGSTGTGVALVEGGQVVNGATSGAALIAGAGYGVLIDGGLGTVANAGTIVGAASYSSTATSAGTVVVTAGATGTGVSLREGGSLGNAAGGVIGGAAGGVAVAGAAGYVDNAGTIYAAATYVNHITTSAYTYVVSGVGGAGVSLGAGGGVVNGRGGTIAGGRYGVLVAGAAGTVLDAGTIASTSAYQRPEFNPGSGRTLYGTQGIGVQLLDGGSVVIGSMSNTAAAVIGGHIGVAVDGAPGTVANYGTIDSLFATTDGYYEQGGGTGVSLGAGGQVTNGASGLGQSVIEGQWYGIRIGGGAGTVNNYGTILTKVYAAIGVAVSLGSGGSVGNAGLIEGTREGVLIAGAAGTVTNEGTLLAFNYPAYGFASSGVLLEAGGLVVNGSAAMPGAEIGGLGAAFGVDIQGGTGTVVNDGTINALYPNTYLYFKPSNIIGIQLHAGGSITNGDAPGVGGGAGGGAGGPLIYAAYGGYAITISGGPGTVTNSGTIAGGTGIDFTTGVTRATVVNAGTIAGTSGTAVAFGTAAATLEVAPGAVFIGQVIAGGTGTITLLDTSGSEPDSGTLQGDVTGAAGTSSRHGSADAATHAVASSAGDTAGGGFSGFSDLDVAAGAQWTVTGNIGDGCTVDLGAGATLAIGGSVGSGAFAFLPGGSALASFAEPSQVDTSFAGFVAGDTIDLVGLVATGISFSSATETMSVTGGGGASLRFTSAYVGQSFAFAPDSHGSTAITLG